jgi:hypothetical protein
MAGSSPLVDYPIRLNLIECAFSQMARTFLRDIRVASVDDFKTRILKAIDEFNASLVVLRWNKFDLGMAQCARVLTERTARSTADHPKRRTAAATASSSEAESSSGVSEQRARRRPIEAQSAAIARAMASICNDELAPSGLMSGHDRKTLSLSGRAKRCSRLLAQRRPIDAQNLSGLDLIAVGDHQRFVDEDRLHHVDDVVERGR